eukprot:6214587-Pleurochrysis_carterae.AAC.2
MVNSLWLTPKSPPLQKRATTWEWADCRRANVTFVSIPVQKHSSLRTQIAAKDVEKDVCLMRT